MLASAEKRYGEETARQRRDGLFFITVHQWGLLALLAMAVGFALTIFT